MSRGQTLDDLGPPDLKIAGLQLWVHGREFPEGQDYFDNNWLRVTAHCGSSGASVWVQGSIVMVPDIAGFGARCAAMLRGDAVNAALDPLEPELSVLLEASDRLGHICAHVQITPDHLAQSHKFDFEIDQSYLPEIVRQCSAIAHEYPIRGPEEQVSNQRLQSDAATRRR